MGAIFFSITMGMAISPAVLGSVMNVSYARALESNLPAELHRFADKATMTALGDPKALLSPAAMKALEKTLKGIGNNGEELFEKTREGIRTSLEAGLSAVFLFGAVTMLISFLLIVTVPEVSMDAVVEDKKAPRPAVAEKAAV